MVHFYQELTNFLVTNAIIAIFFVGVAKAQEDDINTEWISDVMLLNKKDANLNKVTKCLKRRKHWGIVLPRTVRKMQETAEKNIKNTYSSDVRIFFAEHAPVSEMGCIKAIMAFQENINPNLREAIRTNNFSWETKKELFKVMPSIVLISINNLWNESSKIYDQKYFLKIAEPYLFNKYERLNRLLWKRKTTEAKNLFKILFSDPASKSTNQYFAYLGIICFLDNKCSMDYKHIPFFLDAARKCKDAGTLSRWAYAWFLIKNRSIKNAVVEAKIYVDDVPSYQKEAIWDLYIRINRELLLLGNEKFVSGNHGEAAALYKKSVAILKNSRLGLYKGHGHNPTENWQDIIWLLGWTYLHGINDPVSAIECFDQIIKRSYEINIKQRARTIAKINFWKGICMERLKKMADARIYFERAAKYSGFFYGQLAMMKLGMPVIVTFHKDGQASQGAHNLREIVEIMKLSDNETKEMIIKDIAEYSVSDGVALLPALSGSKAFIKTARFIAKRGDVVFKNMFRFINVPTNKIQKELALAIIMKESSFNAEAVGDSGEVGLMQIMPRTAQSEANAIGLNWKYKGLFDPSYNIQIGTSYLRRMLDHFNGNYVFAIAAYNAGTSAVSKWNKFSMNHKYKDEITKMAFWIESIPYSVTRQYVQDVLEKLIIYQNITGSPAFSIDRK